MNNTVASISCSFLRDFEVEDRPALMSIKFSIDIGKQLSRRAGKSKNLRFSLPQDKLDSLFSLYSCG